MSAPRAECGSRQAVYQHRARGERLDPVCMAAEIERRREECPTCHPSETYT